jgi:galactonate dehydratase
VPVSKLLGQQTPKSSVTAYVGGLPGDTPGKQADAGLQFLDRGFGNFKLHYDRDFGALLQSIIALRNRMGPDVNIAVDALWRLAPWTAAPFGRLLDEQNALWLECPLPPEHYVAHGDLARAIKTPIALGESYRSCFELTPFFQARAMQIVQPDLGRCGLTEALRIAQVAALHNKEVVPHVSAGFGPQLAAALQLAAASPNCTLMEYKPWQLDLANRYLTEKIRVEDGKYLVPDTPGLGVTVSLEID